MASSDRTTRLTNIRDNLEKEVEDFTVERLADQAAGRGVRTTYSVNGRSVDWNGYLREMLAQIKAIDDYLRQDEVWEEHVRGYT